MSKNIVKIITTVIADTKSFLRMVIDSECRSNNFDCYNNEFSSSGERQTEKRTADTVIKLCFASFDDFLLSYRHGARLMLQVHP